MNKPTYVAFSTQKGGAGKTTIMKMLTSLVKWLVVSIMSLAFFGKGFGALGWAVVSDTSPKEITETVMPNTVQMQT